MTNKQTNPVSRNAKSCTRMLQNAAFSLLVTLVLGGSLATLRAHAQAVSATLVGTVSDSTGAGVVGARVTILEVATAISRETVTNESGNYTFPDLTPGTYAVSVEARGFKKGDTPTYRCRCEHDYPR